jgi:hypothetical protein
MTGISTNNQLINYHSINGLDKALKVKNTQIGVGDLEIDHRLGPAPLIKEPFFERKIDARQSLELDKDSIIELQDKNQHLEIKDTKTCNFSSIPCSYVDYEIFKERDLTEKELDYMFQRIVTGHKNSCDELSLKYDFVYKIEIEGRKAVFFLLQDGEFRRSLLVEVCENENAYTLKNHSIFCYNDVNDEEVNSLLQHILYKDKENTSQQDTPISTPSYFLDQYLKRRNVADSFATDMMVDEQLQKSLNIIT